ncbi:MAG: hypothetical protein FGM37_08795 [Phycisphaerales bacterium]|nr:hypothetical protein [Phycisphaerales bacterium]
MHARLITGVAPGSPEAEALARAQARHRADAAAAGAAGASTDGTAAAEVQRAQDAVASASRSFGEPRRAVAACLAAILAMLCWPRLRGVGVPRESTPPGTTASPPGIAALVAWSVTLPALLAYIAMRMWVGADAVASLCAAAACATGATFPTAAAWRAARRCDGASGALVAHAGAWCLTVAAAALASAFVVSRWDIGAGGLSVAAALRELPPAIATAACGVCVALLMAPIAGRWLAPPDVRDGSPDPARAWRGVAIDALTAATVALVVAGMDPLSWDFLWAAALFALIAEDGRWLAGWAACYLQGTHTSRDAARVGAMLEENSRPMVAVVAAATATELIAVQQAALLCAAAWALDLTWGVRRLISVAPARQAPVE